MIISKEECAKLSYYRTELMGAAIIMVMFCHNTIQFSENALNLIWKSFSSYFQVGVDIFFLLSSLGCVFSLQKTSGYSGFMKRRIWRIIPTYLVVDGGWCLFQKIIWNTSLIVSIKEYSLISFFTHGILSEWYFAAILVLYAICPFLYNILKRDRKRYCIYLIAILVISISLSFFHLPDTFQTINEIFFVRIPTFGLGIILGDYLKLQKLDNFAEDKAKEGKISCTLWVLFLCVLAFLMVNSAYNNINEWCVMRALFCPLGVLLSIILCRVFQYSDLLKRSFHFLGGMTLELYLIHGKILQVVDSFVQNAMGNGMAILILIQIISILLAVSISFIVNFLITIVRRFNNGT